MNNFEHYIVDLLQHQLEYNNKSVEVRRQFNEAQLPCITLSIASIQTRKVYRKTINGDRAFYERKAIIDINLWCNTEDERETISDLIMQRFVEEQHGHYKYCTQYKNGICKTSTESCLAISDSTARGMKNQCPEPEEMEYESLCTKYNLIPGTVNIEEPVMMDELDKHPVLLRNRFEAEALYYDIHLIDDENYLYQVTEDITIV